MTLVLSSASDHVIEDMPNITKMLSDISGFTVHQHLVEEIRDLEQTDLHLYAVEANHLVDADRMARSLSPKLYKAENLLAEHGLVEVRIGPHLLTTSDRLENGGERSNVIDGSSALSDKEANDDGDDDESEGGSGGVGGMGSLEIALLGMACAVFFGALIALVTICSIRYKRSVTFTYSYVGIFTGVDDTGL